MLDRMIKLRAILAPRDRVNALLLLGLMVLTAFVQTLGVASIMPFLGVLSDPSMIERNEWLQLAYTRFGFESADGFLYFLGIAAFIVFMSGSALLALTQWCITRFSYVQQYKLSRRLMADYMRRPYTFFLSRNSSDLSKTVLQETEQAVRNVLMTTLQLISYSLLALALIALLVAIKPWLALTIAAVLTVLYGTIFISARIWLRRIGRDRIDANRERFTVAAEAFAGAKEIRLLGREREYLRRYKDPSRRFALHQANAALLGSLPQYAIEAIAFGGVLLLILFLMSSGGGIVHALPVIGLYGLAGKQLIPAFQKIFNTVTTIRFNTPALDSVLEELGDRPGSTLMAHLETPGRPLRLKQGITICNLSYRYPDSERVALSDINLHIPATSTIGFVGSSGAGKSTLIDLLLGLLEPDNGEMCIDGVRLTPDNVRNWQATLGYVPQHIFLADQSVASNIALGTPPEEVDHEALEMAARLANLHDFVINELPQGYGTIIGERGVRLSGGQRQRIGIARALYRDPDVLLFDEATSALDNLTERAVMEAIHNLAGKKTIILVAHRLTTVEPCEKIYVLANGQIVEEGSWTQLSGANSHLRRLAASAS